jgi:hypothetical protein
MILSLTQKSNDWIIGNNYLKRIWKAVAEFKVFPRHFPGETEESKDKPPAG